MTFLVCISLSSCSKVNKKHLKKIHVLSSQVTLFITNEIEIVELLGRMKASFSGVN